MTQANNHLAGRKILIVEDELIIAWELQAIVESLSGAVLGPVSSIAAALALLRNTTPDAALLDVNLHGVTVLPVAEECQRQKIPFVVTTGYGRLPLDDPLLNGAVRVRKPFNQSDIAKALATVIASARRCHSRS